MVNILESFREAYRLVAELKLSCKGLKGMPGGDAHTSCCARAKYTKKIINKHPSYIKCYIIMIPDIFCVN